MKNKRYSLPVLHPYLCSSRMEESNPHPSSQSTKSALVVSSAPLLVKGGPCEELVLLSLPLLVRRREGEELVCGTATALPNRLVDRKSKADGGCVNGE